MPKFIALHTYRREPAATMEFFMKNAPALAAAMEAGQVPAKAIKSWIPLAYGRTDYAFCLWEARKVEDVLAVLNSSHLSDYVTCDVMQVDETDWAELAKTTK